MPTPPATWDELIAERWRGKIGQWVRAATLGTLAKVYGEQHMRDYTRKLIELKAMIYPSTFQLAQQVAAGEVDIGMGLYHSAQPVIASGVAGSISMPPTISETSSSSSWRLVATPKFDSGWSPEGTNSRHGTTPTIEKFIPM